MSQKFSRHRPRIETVRARSGRFRRAPSETAAAGSLRVTTNPDIMNSDICGFGIAGCFGPGLGRGAFLIGICRETRFGSLTANIAASGQPAKITQDSRKSPGRMGRDWIFYWTKAARGRGEKGRRKNGDFPVFSGQMGGSNGREWPNSATSGTKGRAARPERPMRTGWIRWIRWTGRVRRGAGRLARRPGAGRNCGSREN